MSQKEVYMAFPRGAVVVLSWVVCVSAVVVLQYFFAVLVGGLSQVWVVASTLLLAALLFPARRKFQDLADRRSRRAR